MDTWDNYRRQQCRSQWVVIRADHIQHKAHLEDTSNGGIVSQGADHERLEMLREHIHRQKLN